MSRLELADMRLCSNFSFLQWLLVFVCRFVSLFLDVASVKLLGSSSSLYSDCNLVPIRNILLYVLISLKLRCGDKT